MRYFSFVSAIAIVASSTSAPAWACRQCRPPVESGVYNQDFAATLFLILLPLLVLCLIGVVIHFWDGIREAWFIDKGNKS